MSKKHHLPEENVSPSKTKRIRKIRDSEQDIENSYSQPYDGPSTSQAVINHKHRAITPISHDVKRLRLDEPYRKNGLRNILSNLNANNQHENLSNSQNSISVDRLLDDAEDLGESGTIERVYVRNFMCHTSLEINFNQNVNFLVGRNGSGKSAILTALVVGLGARASATNRGNSIKGFIKKGEPKGFIEITIRNEGIFAHKRQQYGNKITIIRTILSGGSSSYKIKSASGQIMSTSGKEVARICETLNVQVDNPICVLNQDTSRNFLNSSDPKNKYLLFMKATGLEMVDSYYIKIDNNKREMKNKLKEKIICLEDLTKKLKFWSEKYELIQSLENYVEHLNELKNELFWYNYIQIEKVVKSANNETVKMETEYSTLERDIKEIENTGTCTTETINNLTRQIKDVEQESSGLKTKYQDAKKHHYALNLKHTAHLSDLKQTRSDISLKMNVYDKMNTLITETTKSMEESAQKKQIQLDKKVQFEHRLEEIVAQLVTGEHELRQMQGSIENSRYTNEKLSSDIRSITIEISQKTTQVKSMNRKSCNVLSLFGNRIPSLINAIENRKSQFTEMPRGPLGRYIQVKEKKWTETVENYINYTLLQSFIVTNQKDMKLLYEIMNTVMGNERKPEIISIKFLNKVHDVSKYKMVLPRGMCSLQDMLVISDPNVENCLIDSVRIESVILIPTSTDAYRIMSNIENVPKNCSVGVTLEGDLFYPAPKYKTYSGHNKPVRFLQVNMDEAAQQIKADIEHLENKCVKLKEQLKANNLELTTHERLLNNREKHISNLRAVKMKIQKEISMIRLDDDIQNIDVLNKEFSVIKQSLDELKLKETQYAETLDKLKTELDAANNSLASLEESMTNFKDRVSPLEKQKAEQNTKLLKLETEKNHKLQTLEEMQEKIIILKRKQKDQQKQLDELAKKTDDFSKRINNPRSQKVIQEEQNKIQKAIEQIQSTNEDPEFVEKMYTICKEKHEYVVGIIDVIQENLVLLTKSIENRAAIYDLLVKKISSRVKNMFRNVLELRNYQGSININHNTKELEIRVQTQNTKHKTSDTRILSGGERSYSTVAFIMALWSCVKFPFYFMDEFDVFMDKVNRQTIMNLLLQHAEEHPERQFVFLTPQDISNITSKPTLTIHRMPDPERNELNIK